MRKHIECNKSRENPILKLLVVPKASPGASPLLMLLQELSHVQSMAAKEVIWDEFGWLVMAEEEQIRQEMEGRLAGVFF